MQNVLQLYLPDCILMRFRLNILGILADVFFLSASDKKVQNFILI